MLALHQVIVFVIEDMGCFQQGRRVLLTQGAACGEVTQMFAYWISVSRLLQEECQFVCSHSCCEESQCDSLVCDHGDIDSNKKEL